MSNPYAPPQGYPPPPRQPMQQAPERTVTVSRDGRGMATLRVITYLLASLASLLFIALVVYGYLQLRQAQSALDGLLRGGVPGLVLPLLGG